jgi:hypothetical protein
MPLARKVCLILSLGFLTSSCGLHAVRPYERANLNRPGMQREQDTAHSVQRTRSIGAHEAMRTGRSDAAVVPR